MRNTNLTFAFFVTVALGCLNADPLPNLPDATVDVETPPEDASVDGDDASLDPNAVCLNCLRDGACADPYAACMDEPHCKSTLECAFPLGCFRKGTFVALYQCGSACSAEAGIINQTSPGYAPLVAIITCDLDPMRCGYQCGVPMP